MRDTSIGSQTKKWGSMLLTERSKHEANVPLMQVCPLAKALDGACCEGLL